MVRTPLGDTSPTLPKPPPPPPPKTKCGGIAAVVVTVVSVVVATVITGYLTGIGVPYPIAAGIGSFAGSIISQYVAVQAGLQEEVDFGAAANSGLVDGLTAGLTRGSKGEFNNFGKALGVGGRAALSASIGQGVKILTTGDNKFDWRAVAASTVGALVVDQVNEQVGGPSNAGLSANQRPTPQGFGYDFARGIFSGAINELIIKPILLKDYKPQWSNVAGSALGGALGNYISAQQNYEQEQVRRQAELNRLREAGVPTVGVQQNAIDRNQRQLELLGGPYDGVEGLQRESERRQFFGPSREDESDYDADLSGAESERTRNGLSSDELYSLLVDAFGTADSRLPPNATEVAGPPVLRGDDAEELNDEIVLIYGQPIPADKLEQYKRIWEGRRSVAQDIGIFSEWLSQNPEKWPILQELNTENRNGILVRSEERQTKYRDLVDEINLNDAGIFFYHILPNIQAQPLVNDDNLVSILSFHSIAGIDIADFALDGINNEQQLVYSRKNNNGVNYLSLDSYGLTSLSGILPYEDTGISTFKDGLLVNSIYGYDNEYYATANLSSLAEDAILTFGGPIAAISTAARFYNVVTDLDELRDSIKTALNDLDPLSDFEAQLPIYARIINSSVHVAISAERIFGRTFSRLTQGGGSIIDSGALTEHVSSFVYELAESEGFIDQHFTLQNRSGHGVDHIIVTANDLEIIPIEDKASRYGVQQLGTARGSNYPGVPAASQQDGGQAYLANRIQAALRGNGYSIGYGEGNYSLNQLNTAYNTQLREHNGARGYVLQLTKFGKNTGPRSNRQNVDYRAWKDRRPFSGHKLNVFGHARGTFQLPYNRIN